MVFGVVVVGTSALPVELADFGAVKRVVTEAIAIDTSPLRLAAEFQGITLTVCDQCSLDAALKLLQMQDGVPTLYAIDTLGNGHTSQSADSPIVLGYAELDPGKWSDAFRLPVRGTLRDLAAAAVSALPRDTVSIQDVSLSFALVTEGDKEIDLDDDEDVRLLLRAVDKYGPRGVRIQVRSRGRPTKMLAGMNGGRAENGASHSVQVVELDYLPNCSRSYCSARYAFNPATVASPVET